MFSLEKTYANGQNPIQNILILSASTTVSKNWNILEVFVTSKKEEKFKLIVVDDD